MNYTYYVIYDTEYKLFLGHNEYFTHELLDAERFTTIEEAAKQLLEENEIIQMACAHAIIACDIARPPQIQDQEEIHLKADALTFD